MDAINDPVALVDSLQPDAIRGRLAELERQSRALRVLLRSAVARERQVVKHTQQRPASGQGAGHGG